MSKLDELIDWHEKHATYYTDSAVLQQTHRDTAEALRKLKALALPSPIIDKVFCPMNANKLRKADPRVVQAAKDFRTALAALRDAGMMDPPKPASGREQGQRGGE